MKAAEQNRTGRSKVVGGLQGGPKTGSIFIRQ